MALRQWLIKARSNVCRGAAQVAADFRSGAREYKEQHAAVNAPLPVEPEPFCYRCGSRDLTPFGNTHVRCAACGYYIRLIPADADSRPKATQQEKVTAFVK